MPSVLNKRTNITNYSVYRGLCSLDTGHHHTRCCYVCVFGWLCGVGRVWGRYIRLKQGWVTSTQLRALQWYRVGISVAEQNVP